MAVATTHSHSATAKAHSGVGLRSCAFFRLTGSVKTCVLHFLIYLSPLFIGAGVGTCFPISPAAKLLVGCQWVIEPVLSPLLNKLTTHQGVINCGKGNAIETKLANKFYINTRSPLVTGLPRPGEPATG